MIINQKLMKRKSSHLIAIDKIAQINFSFSLEIKSKKFNFRI
jgi:hypothetical protein